MGSLKDCAKKVQSADDLPSIKWLLAY